MTVNYTIDNDDILIYQLYIASKSDRIKKSRLRNRVVVPLVYIALGLLFFVLKGRLAMIIAFPVIGVLWFFIYPLWERRRYVKHYQGFIKENYTDRPGKNVTLEFNNDCIVAKDSGNESKTLTTELEEINEMPTLVIIKFKGSLAFVLPKDKIDNIDNVVTELKKLANYLKIDYNIDENWKWK